MSINPFMQATFSMTAMCLPCCAAATPGCGCALFIPPFSVPYADYATAAGEITDRVNNCIGYYIPSSVDTTAFTASFDGTTLALDTNESNATDSGFTPIMYASVSLLAGAVVSSVFSISTNAGTQGISLSLFRCDSTNPLDPIDQDSSTATSGTLSVTADVDGEYTLLWQSQTGAPPGPLGTFTNITTSTTCNAVYWVNPVIALWDDSGTTRQLEACPMNVDPPCSSFSSLSAAEDELASGNVVDCLGILAAESGVTINSASVSSGPPAVFNFNISNTGASSIANPTLSVGLDAGDTVVVSYNLVTNGLSGGGGAIFAEFLDTDCVQLDSSSFVFWGSPVISPMTGTLVTFTAPYKGRFIIRCFVQSADSPASGTWDVSGSVTLTPSASMPVYPVTVAYLICTGVFPDITCLTCPAHLDCT